MPFSKAFQNISCYCLTLPGCVHCGSLDISKHLMLLFNVESLMELSLSYIISKHLMLLFNGSGKASSGSGQPDFKTSHVIV